MHIIFVIQAERVLFEVGTEFKYVKWVEFFQILWPLFQATAFQHSNIFYKLFPSEWRKHSHSPTP